MIEVILSIIGIIIAIILEIVKIKYIKGKYYRLRRRCINCGYSRDDIENAWQIYEPDNTQIRCQKCKTVQKKWKQK